MTTIQVMETLSRVAPLGVRFWDPVERTPVSAGLVVTIWPASQPERRIPAVLNRSDVFSFLNLPGMREVENGAGDDAFWAAQTPRFDFVVDVADSWNRFLPYRFAVKLPVRGLPEAHPLFSSAARTLVGPMGVIRAQLFDPIHRVPAAWAMVEARVAGLDVARGMADSQGSLLLPLPYPEAQSA